MGNLMFKNVRTKQVSKCSEHTDDQIHVYYLYKKFNIN